MNGPGWWWLPGSPWSVRMARGSGGRPALEVYAGGSLVDVMVASSRGSLLLHGACRAGAGGRPRCLAWGCLPAAGGQVPRVEVSRGRVRRHARPAEAQGLADWFWLADAAGTFSHVQVTSQAERQSCRIPAAGAC